MVDIDSITYGQIKAIAALACGLQRTQQSESVVPRRVIVRSYGAGVFFGTIVAKRDNEVDLVDCRRIWNWTGANTCSELALTGPNPKGSRVAKPTPKHTVLEVLEIIDCQPEAIKVLESAEWNP